MDESSSLFAWWRLLCYYEANDQPKAVLVCVAEILDRAEEDGITEWEHDTSQKASARKSNFTHQGRYPAWLEQSLANVVAKYGYRLTMKFAKDLDVMD